MADILTPALGESVTEATIGKWTKKAGDAVKKDEVLVELETDKVTLEVNAPAAGELGEILAKDGETVEPGALLGSIVEAGAGGGAKAAAPKKTETKAETRTEEPAKSQSEGAAKAPAEESSAAYGNHGDAAAPATPVVAETPWRFGTGAFNDASKQLVSFAPLPHATGSAWQGAADWPGGATGWAQLTASGGHPTHDVRRYDRAVAVLHAACSNHDQRRSRKTVRR